MRGRARLFSSLVVGGVSLGLVACAPQVEGHREGLRDPESAAPSELVGLEVVGSLAEPGADDAPPASDAPPRQRVAFRMADGALLPVDREAIASVPRWREGAALVDPQRRLYEVFPDGRRRMLAAEVIAVLATDGARLAYVTERGFLATLHVHDGQRDEIWASQLASIGQPRFVGDEVYFVGGAPGGVAGLFVATREGARCLTNCALRTGTDWRTNHVPLPGDLGALIVEPARVTFVDVAGHRHEVAR